MLLFFYIQYYTVGMLSIIIFILSDWINISRVSTYNNQFTFIAMVVKDALVWSTDDKNLDRTCGSEVDCFRLEHWLHDE